MSDERDLDMADDEEEGSDEDEGNHEDMVFGSNVISHSMSWTITNIGKRVAARRLISSPPYYYYSGFVLKLSFRKGKKLLDHASLLVTRHRKKGTPILASCDACILAADGTEKAVVSDRPIKPKFITECTLTAFQFDNFVKLSQLTAAKTPTGLVKPNGSLVIRVTFHMLNILNGMWIGPSDEFDGISPNHEEDDLQSDVPDKLVVPRDSIGSDLTIVASNGATFPAHRVILCASSPVFAAMFEYASTVEARDCRIDMADTPAEVVDAMLTYIYGGTVVLPSSKDLRATELPATLVSDLYVVADKYDLVPLRSACETEMIAGLTVENVVDVFLLADLHSAGRLRHEALLYFRANLVSVKATEGWQRLVQYRPQVAQDVAKVKTQIQTNDELVVDDDEVHSDSDSGDDIDSDDDIDDEEDDVDDGSDSDDDDEVDDGVDDDDL